MGKVYLVGAGPGAPDLITLRAARLIEAADIVFHDALVHPDTVALAAKAVKVAVGKRAGQVSTDQRFINRQLVEAARHHAIVVRLKGGDPMIFGRAQEEIESLAAAGIEFEVVPGITAALAASAQLGRSLTRRGLARTVSFVTPRVMANEGPNETESDWLDAAVAADTTVLYMAAGQAPDIARRLIASGKAADTPVAIVENATLDSEQRILTTLAALTASRFQFTGPAVLCVGQVFAATQAEQVHSSRMRELHATRCRLA
ncbi:MAG: uroporphyrinogen-III C-methyltransferase [Betaproteobacteria bacterium]|nr:uroporphyrinogen-III C-methyltransferase [Betaproteobacteria bacterium]